jgi:hypothetical protein
MTLSESEKPFIDSIYMDNTNNQLVVFWISPVPNEIINSFTTKLNLHDASIPHPDNFKLYRYTDLSLNDRSEPHCIDFSTMLNVGLEKGEVIFDHKGSPKEVIYTYNDEEICKRTWEFIYFSVETIMNSLQVDLPTATLMADDLVWIKREKFHWMKENGAEISTLEQTEETTVDWCRTIMLRSPLAIRMIKRGLNAELDGQHGIMELAGDATLMFYLTEEAQEGKHAFLEKRDPDFQKFPKFP